MKNRTKIKTINRYSFFLALAFTFFVLNIKVFGQVNTTGGVSLVQGDNPPHVSAMLDIISSNKGVLLPRLTTSQRMAITPLEEGLLVYDLTKQAFYYVDQASCWREMENHKTGTLTCDESSGKVPVGGIISFFPMNPNDITNLFDGTGLGHAKYDGWAICNGNNYTPDLQGSFIVGVGQKLPASNGELENTNYQFTNQGGLNKYTLKSNESGSPAHKHQVTASIAPGATMNYDGFTEDDGSHFHNIEVRQKGSQTGIHNTGFRRGPIKPGDVKTATAGIHKHAIKITGNVNLSGQINGDTENSSGADATAAHENRPPFYALYYIMRIK
ncbi:MAG: hypothetical protein H0V01_04475 [Bacteroidetes bacterium]|nr:hypothetical protein [Bacteroidota bacterium]HET6243907.1 hypothetical protein [Bacteroidia bacterium]